MYQVRFIKGNRLVGFDEITEPPSTDKLDRDKVLLGADYYDICRAPETSDEC